MPQSYKPYTPAQKAKRNAKLKALRDDGFCVKCCYKEPAPGKVSCQNCLETDARLKRERRKKRYEAGLCVTCGKAPRKKGLINCVGCIEVERARVRRAMRGIRAVRKKAAKKAEVAA